MSVNTIKILSLDGGGARGYLSNCFFQKFIQLWGIDATDIWKYFDVITGSSFGGISALAYAFGLTTADVGTFYTDDTPWIFTTGILGIAPSASNRPDIDDKVSILDLNEQFYTSSSSSYGSTYLKQRMNSIFGTNTLQNLKTNIVIPTYAYDTKKSVLLSNLNFAEFSGKNELIANTALMTSATPLYLPPFTGLNGHQYIGGRIYDNNPAQLGVTLGKMLKPNANRCCVLSLGTGISQLGFYQPPTTSPFQDGVTRTVELLDISITGAQEAINKNLFLESQYTLDNVYCYRFQPTLDSTLYDTELDNTDTLYFKYLKQTAINYFDNDIANITTFLGHLTA